jgi:hypothetical protein
MATLMDIVAGAFGCINIQTSSRSMSSSTANAGELTPTGSASIVTATNVGSTPGTLTTRTAAQMIADGPLSIGQTWVILLCNFQGTGTLTLGGGSNVTVGGTATVAVNTCRIFTATVSTATTVTITGLAIGFTGNV